MPKGVQFDPDFSTHRGSSVDAGGVMPGEAVDVHNYKAPRGPRNINEPKSPGLHGKNFDYCGSQEQTSLKSQSSGSPGIGGSTNKCSQGRY